jgi:hypothetical protein
MRAGKEIFQNFKLAMMKIPISYCTVVIGKERYVSISPIHEMRREIERSETSSK